MRGIDGKPLPAEVGATSPHSNLSTLTLRWIDEHSRNRKATSPHTDLSMPTDNAVQKTAV